MNNYVKILVVIHQLKMQSSDVNNSYIDIYHHVSVSTIK